MARKRHIPQRTCIACRAVKAKRELVRIVRTPARTVAVDQTGKAPGRGAYLCKQQSCWEKGLTKDAIKRVLKVSVVQEEAEDLRNYVASLS